MNDIGDCTTQGSTFVQSKTAKRLEGAEGKAVELSAGYGALTIQF